MSTILRNSEQELKLKNKSLLLFSIITTLILVIMEVVSLFQKIEYTNIGYLVPIAAGAILIRSPLNERLAYFRKHHSGDLRQYDV